MLTRSITFAATLLLGFSMLGCGSSVKTPQIGASDKPTIYKVQQDLKARFAKDDRLQGSNITFAFDGATVILSGTVKDTAQFGWAATVAGGTPGVQSVINRLQVEPTKPEAAEKPKTQEPARKPVPKTETAKPPTSPAQTS
ncbi:MAG TPA: BON domain-containing protein [Terriglobales bacterium]|nr:BON domain-containing protein [Terriglobales bacterium]